MPGQPFSLANLTGTAHALRPELAARPSARYPLAIRTVKGWFGGRPLPDLRKRLADLCRGRDDPAMVKLANSSWARRKELSHIGDMDGS